MGHYFLYILWTKKGTYDSGYYTFGVVFGSDFLVGREIEHFSELCPGEEGVRVHEVVAPHAPKGNSGVKRLSGSLERDWLVIYYLGLHNFFKHELNSSSSTIRFSKSNACFYYCRIFCHNICISVDAMYYFSYSQNDISCQKIFFLHLVNPEITIIKKPRYNIHNPGRSERLLVARTV